VAIGPNRNRVRDQKRLSIVELRQTPQTIPKADAKLPPASTRSSRATYRRSPTVRAATDISSMAQEDWPAASPFIICERAWESGIWPLGVI